MKCIIIKMLHSVSTLTLQFSDALESARPLAPSVEIWRAAIAITEHLRWYVQELSESQALVSVDLDDDRALVNWCITYLERRVLEGTQ